MDDRKNWAGNHTYSAKRFHFPTTIEQAREVVKSCHKLRALGSRHSFNAVADSTEDIISLERLDPAIELDRNRRTVTVSGGVKYGQLCRELHEQGYALHNLASLPHICIAGACATATHGSGDKNGNLATAVAGLEIVTAEGEVLKLSREKDGKIFPGAVVNLGALGVVTKATLDIQPTFEMRQDVYVNLPLARLKEHFEDIMSAGYSVSLFTDWQDKRVNEVWLKRRIEKGVPLDAKPEFYGAKLATKNLHPIAELSAENCTEQMGIAGPWYERLPHFRMGFTPSSGKELQSEYFVPRMNAVDAILAVERLRERVSPHLLITEIRTIAADQLWMSPCYEQPCVTIHFTWKQDWPAVSKLLPTIEKELAPFHARPHWGKLFTTSPAALKSAYKKMPEFIDLSTKYDPKGKFRNEFLNKNVFGN